MKTIINPTYNALSSFINRIPDIFDQEGELVFTARNQLKSYTVEGVDLIVKRYKKPHLINRIAYTFFRPSKAKRAYDYALRLLELNINTPMPIAYIEQKSFGLLDHGFFISVYEKEYSDIREFMIGTQTDDTLLQHLAKYIAHFHSKGVLHFDMSPGNVLYKKVKDNYLFTLIDINRMHFSHSISKTDRYKSFKRLSENKSVLTRIATLYAAAAQLDESESVERINYYCTEF